MTGRLATERNAHPCDPFTHRDDATRPGSYAARIFGQPQARAGSDPRPEHHGVEQVAVQGDGVGHGSIVERAGQGGHEVNLTAGTVLEKAASRYFDHDFDDRRSSRTRRVCMYGHVGVKVSGQLREIRFADLKDGSSALGSVAGGVPEHASGTAEKMNPGPHCKFLQH